MKHLSAVLLCLVLAACGGGSSSSSPTPGGTISGLAASGAAIAGRIYIEDSAGHEHYVDTTDGHYSFSLAGLTPPFMLKAVWSNGGTTKTLYSFSASGGTTNITPLTQMAVTAAAGSDMLDAIYASPSPGAFASIANALPTAVADLEDALAPLFAKYSASGIDPITGSFAADHTGMDALLDSIAISYLSGTVSVTDVASGALILEASCDDLPHGLSMPNWSAQDAAVANDPDVAVDASGKGLIVWSELIGSHYYIRGRFLDGLGTSVTTLSSSGDSALPRVAFDASGNALVVWAQYESARNDIWASHYDAVSQSWSSPLRISATNAVADAYTPDVAVDGAGSAIVSWSQGDGRVNHFDGWATTYAAAQDSWAVPVLVSDGINSAYDVRVAVDAGGEGLVAWEQEQGDGTTVSNGPKDIWARTVTTAGTWGPSTMLNAMPGNVDSVYGQVAVAMDSQGNGGVLWVQTSGVLPFVIHAAMYSAANGWQASAVITSNVLDNCYGPHFAYDGSGNAVAVWQQQTGIGAYGAANRYVVGSGAGSGWGTSGPFTEDIGDVYDPHVAIDGAGNATAVWWQWEQTGINVRTNRYLAGGGWGTSSILSTTPTDGGFSYPVPRVAANASGRTVAIWGTDSF